MNTQNTAPLLVIASYPPRGEKHSKAIVGGAMYAKNTLEATKAAAEKRDLNLNIIVLAEKLAHPPRHSEHSEESRSFADAQDDIYNEDGIQIKRFWKKNSFSTYPSLLKEILTQKKAKKVVIEFELVMFGESLSLIPLPLFLLMLRLLGKRVIFVFHQVLGDVAEMSGHLNLPEKSVKTKIFNFLYQTLFYFLITFSSECIVFEEILKKRLKKLQKNKKITVIPFGTENFPERTTQQKAREILGLPNDTFIVFSFGFIAWYKGTDWLVDQFTQKKIPDVLLIIGGGPNPNHIHKDFYKSYIDSVEKKCQEAGIIVTGFIAEEKMPLYFESADLVVLPYRTLMSSSGPLSLAYSFSKPVILSSPLEELLLTKDMPETMQEAGITSEDLLFPLTSTFQEKLSALKKDNAKLRQLTAFSKALGEKRSWNEIGRMYADIFFAK